MKHFIHIYVFLFPSFFISLVNSECDALTGFYPWGGYCYKFSDEGVHTFEKGQTECHKEAATLPLVTSAEENRFIANNMQLAGAGPANEHAGVYTNHVLKRDINGNWVVDNAPYSNVTSWYGMGDLHQVVIDHSGKWTFQQRDRKFHYLCKKNDPDFTITERGPGHGCIVKKSGRTESLLIKSGAYFATDKALYFCGNGLMITAKEASLGI